MANIYFKCSCDKSLAIDERGAGKVVHCPDCRQPIQIPLPDFKCVCSKCGVDMLAPSNMIGQDVKCTDCKHSTTIGYANENDHPSALLQSAGITKKAVRPSHSADSDFFAFRTMVTPLIIKIAFWIGIVACIVGGIFMFAYATSSNKSEHVYLGIAVFLFGPILVRIACEFFILFFRINETLTEIKNKLKD